MTPKTLNFTTNNVTGNRQLSGFPYIPSYVRLITSQKNSTSEAFVHQSTGFTDFTSKACHSIYWDASGGKTVRFSDRVVNHINRVSGTLTDIIVADTIAFVDLGGGDIRCNINFPATVSGYRIDMELFP